MKIYNSILYVFFISNAFFQPTLSVAQLFHELSFKILLRCCLIHMTIIVHVIFYIQFIKYIKYISTPPPPSPILPISLRPCCGITIVLWAPSWLKYQKDYRKILKFILITILSLFMYHFSLPVRVREQEMFVSFIIQCAFVFLLPPFSHSPIC